MATTFFSIDFFLSSGEHLVTRIGYSTEAEAKKYAESYVSPYGRFEIKPYTIAPDYEPPFSHDEENAQWGDRN